MSTANNFFFRFLQGKAREQEVANSQPHQVLRDTDFIRIIHDLTIEPKDFSMMVDKGRIRQGDSKITLHFGNSRDSLRAFVFIICLTMNPAPGITIFQELGCETFFLQNSSPNYNVILYVMNLDNISIIYQRLSESLTSILGISLDSFQIGILPNKIINSKKQNREEPFNDRQTPPFGSYFESKGAAIIEKERPESKFNLSVARTHKRSWAERRLK